MACIVDPTALLVWHVLLRLCKWVVGDIETRLWLREQRLASLIWATGSGETYKLPAGAAFAQRDPWLLSVVCEDL